MYNFLFLFLAMCSTAFSEEQWKIDEKEILRMAQLENLPIVAVFIRSNECPWSDKFVHDVLHSPRFASSIGIDAILWEISLAKEEEDLAILEKYRVNHSPQIVLLDPQGKEFARLEYFPLDADTYAKEILELIDHFQEVCVALDDPKIELDEARYQDLYVKAQKFSVPCFRQVICEKGYKKEKGTFFHVEKYAAMLEKYKLKNPEVVKLKKKILSRDPQNNFDTHFKVAILDFHKRASGLKAKDRCEKALIPLLNYMHRFKECANLWKIELMIAEFLYSKNRFQSALEHAENSLKIAPIDAKPQILQAISGIKNAQI